jgi:hypothetical protein
MDTGDLPGLKCGQGVMLTTHPLLVPWIRKERAYTSPPPVRQNVYPFFLPNLIKKKRGLFL